MRTVLQQVCSGGNRENSLGNYQSGLSYPYLNWHNESQLVYFQKERVRMLVFQDEHNHQGDSKGVNSPVSFSGCVLPLDIKKAFPPFNVALEFGATRGMDKGHRWNMSFFVFSCISA